MTKVSKEINIYIMGGGIFFASFIILMLLMFIEIPEKNRDIVNVSTGSFFSMAMMVVGFFFGSSNKEKATPKDNTEPTK
jgi:hypothetical protein